MLSTGHRRTQRERSDTTSRALVAAARELFAERGFHATPAEAVTRRAGVTSGAMYHHFRSKRELFRTAFEAVERSLAERVARAAAGAGDPWERLERGVEEYLRAVGEPEVRRIVLVDGPSVLGWDEWRAADATHHLRPLAAALAGAMRRGLVDRRPPEPLARLLLGALTEAGLATGEDARAAHDGVLWLLRRLRREAPP
jgi:AcrR family transcriptional regulator